MTRILCHVAIAASFALAGTGVSAQVLAQQTPGASIRLPNPDLAAGESIGQRNVENAIKAAVASLDDSIRESTATMPAADREVFREVVIAQVPVGYGTLRSTRRTQDPGPRVGQEDPRVINLERQPLLERLIGKSNFLPVGYLSSGVNAARSVARVAVKFTSLPEAGLGTGFMISPTLFMTNHHVIGTTLDATRYELQFNYQFSDDNSRLLPHVTYEFDPQTAFFTDPVLDFTVIAVKPRRRSEAGVMTLVTAGEEFGSIALTKDFFYSEHQFGNVIQHPGGQHKQIAIHENELVAIHRDVIRYKTDTEPGSSGSPVMNNLWRIIALHHAAGEKDPETGMWLNNEGIRIDVIIDKIKAARPELAKLAGIN